MDEITTLTVVCRRLNLAFSEIARAEGEVMVMMSDADAQTLKEYNANYNIIPGSWDGGD